MHGQVVPSGGNQLKQGKIISSRTKAAFKGPLFSDYGREKEGRSNTETLMRFEAHSLNHVVASRPFSLA